MISLDFPEFSEQHQLNRYAEDFGRLYTEYLDVRSRLDLALNDNRANIFTQLYARAPQAIMVTDEYSHILSVNPAFTRITGYVETEVVGQTPRLLSSGRHDQDFYNAMWRTLADKDEWQGEIWNRRKNGEAYPEWLQIFAVRDEAGQVRRYVGTFHDMTGSQANQRIYELANHDLLTGLPNRAMCRDRLHQSIARAHHDHSHFGLLLIELDRFKDINNTLGHVVGDTLLIEFSWRLVHAIGDDDIACRIGGDEFVVISPDIAGENGLRKLADKIFASLKQPFAINNRELYVGASIGIATYPAHGDSAEDLLRRADTAMYAARADGGNACRFYDEMLDRERVLRLDMEDGLRRALAQQQFSLAYQPQVNAENGRIVGVEALLRWHWPGQGNVPPDRFIPLAEDTDLILPIGVWVLHTACGQLAEWRRAGLPLIRMAVNVSMRQLNDPAFASCVEAVLAENDLPPSALEIEITESQLMENINIGHDNLLRLRTMGIAIAIDDFGTGHSSLSRIRSLPIDRIKVDKSFVNEVVNNSNSYAIAHAILAMANALQLETIAEGIEHDEQAILLAGLQCGEFQGYLFGKPQTPEAIAELLIKQQGEAS